MNYMKKIRSTKQWTLIRNNRKSLMLKPRIKVFLAVFSIALYSLNVSGHEQQNKVDIGFNVSQYQREFGVGVHLISPYFINSKVAGRVGANLQWFEYFDGAETTWVPYQNFQLGLRGRNIVIENKLFVYGEGGLIAIMPNSDFSSKNSEYGGYGVFGFEFKPSSKIAYFIELGGVGTGAKADRIDNKPIYSNGFITNVGFRIGI